MPNAALLNGSYVGLLRHTYPKQSHTLHGVFPDLPMLQISSLPTCNAAFCWHITELRTEFGSKHDEYQPLTIRHLTVATDLHNDIIAPSEAGESAGSIHTLRALYRYCISQLKRPLLLDEVLSVPATATLLISIAISRKKYVVD